jgi:hypothetical protein
VTLTAKDLDTALATPKVAGYRPLEQTAVALVNQNKRMEEYILRRIEELQKRSDTDKRMLAKGFTDVQQAFMWINRAIFKPERIEL